MESRDRHPRGGAGAGTPNEVNGAAGYNPQVPVAQGPLLGADAAGVAARTADWLAAAPAPRLPPGGAAAGRPPPARVAEGPVPGAGPAGVEARTADWLAADSATFLDRGAAALTLL